MPSNGICVHLPNMRQGSMVSQWLLPTELHELKMIN